MGFDTCIKAATTVVLGAVPASSYSELRNGMYGFDSRFNVRGG